MAENKLSWSELRHELALRAGVKEAEANAFLNALQSQLIEALKTDTSVKINGLGTFKRQAVAPRKSVNVSTGEEITIEGYNKIAFTPEAGVKELVEKGVTELGVTAKALGLNEEPAEPSFDPLKKLGAQAEEIVDILGELGQRPTDDMSQKIEEPAPVVEKEPQKVIEEPAPVVEEKHVEVSKSRDLEVSTSPKKPQYHFLRDTLICVVLLLMLLLVGYFFLRSQLSSWIEGLVNQQPQPQTEIVAPPQEPVVEIAQPQTETPQPKTETPQTDKWTYDEFLLTEQITEGSRLTWIAKKHYGNKAYWPHLYAANKDRIKNPGKIAVGTPIRVPKLTTAQRDTTDARFLQIQQEALEAMKK